MARARPLPKSRKWSQSLLTHSPTLSPTPLLHLAVSSAPHAPLLYSLP